MAIPEPHPTPPRCPACRDAPWLAWLCRTQRALADVALRTAAAGAGRSTCAPAEDQAGVMPRAA